MNPMGCQEEINRPATMTSLQHCIFNWRIHKISFCLVFNKFSFKGSPFDLKDGSKWRLGLNIERSRTTYILYPHLYRVPGESNLEEIKVRFRLTLQLPIGSSLGNLKSKMCTFTEGKRSGRILKINRSTLQDLINKVKDDDTLVIVCEMMAVGVINAIWKGISCHLDIQVLSRNFSNLLQDNLLTNITLVMKGNQHIKAHKEILSIWSDKFTELMETSKCRLEIPSYTYEVVKAMLIFLYSGSVNELTINNPPPLELYECAKYYGVERLIYLLKPQELSEVTTIKPVPYKSSWTIKDFLTLYGAKNVGHKLSIKDGFLENSWLELGLDFERDGSLTFYIKVITYVEVNTYNAACKKNPECVIVNDITISDALGKNPVTMRLITPLYAGEECTFKLSLDSSYDYSTLIPPDDSISIICDFKYILLPITYSNEGIEVHAFNSRVCKYNALSSQMRERFWNLPHTDTEIDVLCSNELVRKPAHKSVFCARSSIIQGLLTGERTSLPPLICSRHSANALLYYIYTGTLYRCSVQTLIDLHNLACRFGIPVLRDKCHRLMYSQVTLETANKIFLFAYCHKYEDLKRLCVECILQSQTILGSYGDQ